MSKKITIRPATVGDVSLIKNFIYALAEFEKLSHECIVQEQDLIATLFGKEPQAKVNIAFVEGVAAGFCLYFYNYSTFLGQRGLHLEDLFVQPEFRGLGIGKSLLLNLVKIATDENCGRLEWNVLDWNKPAIEFYHSLGAKPLADWTIFRLDKKAMENLL